MKPHHPQPPLAYLITNGITTPKNYTELKPQILRTLKNAVDNGISFVQLREKNITTRQLFDLAASSVSITADSETKLMINGRPDIAAASGADGVHLPETGLPVDAVKIAFPGLLIGVSVHSEQAARTAKQSGADHIIFGNVHATPGKGEPAGVKKLKAVCEAVFPMPVIAVGGIGVDEIGDVLKAGAAGFAAIRLLNSADGQNAAMKKIRELDPQEIS